MNTFKIGMMAIVLILALPGMALAHDCGAPAEYDLYAGRDILVGCVMVCNDGDTLTVIFDTAYDCDDNPTGWPITETHLAVASSLGDIPHTKKGNPIPGRFPFAGYHSPAATSVTYDIPYEEEIGNEVFIAAHAVVWNPDSVYTMQVCSDGNETYTAYNNAVLGPDNGAVDGRTGTAQPSAEPYGEQTDAANSAWDEYVGAPFTDGSDCADWIWEDNFKFSQTQIPCDPATDGPTCINEAVNPINGDRVEFTDTFAIPGPPVGGMLYATCDNAYEAYVNTTTPGAPVISGQTGPGWWTSNLFQEYVDWNNWQSVESGALTGLTMGSNFLFFRAANEYFNTDDIANSQPGNTPIEDVCCPAWWFVPTAYINPAGIIWQADIDYLSMDETAWGDGGYGFPGRNWATYLIYDWQ